MTWTVTVDSVMPACARTAAACPATACTPTAYAAIAFTVPVSRGPGTVRRVTHGLASVRAASRRVRPLPWPLLRGDVAILAGWSPDPGRDVLCLLTSRPRRFQ